MYAPDEDPNMTVEQYERSKEQNEELGISEEMLAEEMEKKEKTPNWMFE